MGKTRLPRPADVSKARDLPCCSPSLATTVSAALRRNERTLRHCARSLRHGPDVEAVHDMRAAIRASRAVVRELILTGHGRRQWMLRYDSELSWLARQLGPARDLDILLENVEMFAQGHPVAGECHSDVEALHAEIIRRRHQAYRHVVRVVSTRRFKRILHATRRQAQPSSHLSRALAGASTGEFASIALWHAYGAIIASANALPASTIEPWHQLRIAARRLRYLLETVSAGRDEHASEMMARLIACQQGLGALHDCSARITLAREITRKLPVTAGASAYLEAQQAQLKAALVDAPESWQRLRDPDFAQLLAGCVEAIPI